MPTIRPYTSRESPYTGGIQTRASPEAFGAGVGRELEQLGNAVMQLGPTLQAAKDKQDEDLIANAVSTYDPSMKMYDARTNSTDPIETAKGTLDWMTPDIQQHVESKIPNNPRAQQKAIRALNARRPGVMAAQSTWAKNEVDTRGQLLLNDGLNALQNRMYTTPNDYDQIVSDSDQQIDRMTDVPLSERSQMKVTQRQDLAMRRFEALTADATTTEGLDALEAELKSPTWGDRMNPKDVDATLRGIKAARTTLYTQFRTEAQAAISSMGERNTAAEVIPREEVQAAWEKVKRANDPGLAHNLGAIAVQQDELRKVRKLPKIELDGLDYEEAPHANPDDTNFLMPLLAPGHASNSITGLQAPFANKLRRLIESAPPEVREGLGVLSGYRSIEHQRQLHDEAIRKYGRDDIPGHQVAKPGNSQHNFGLATDLSWKGGYFSDAPKAVQDWVHSHAVDFGLSFPVNGEAWHIEDSDARAGKATAGNLTMDKLLPAMMQVESGFNPGAVSPKGAAGIMQVMPDTAREIAAEIGDQNFPAAGGDVDIQKYLSNPTVGTRYGAHYMQKQLDKYGGDLEAALIAYNAGPEVADQFLKEGRSYQNLPPETQNYIVKVRENLTEQGVTEDQYLRSQVHERVAAAENKAFANGNGMDLYRDAFGLSMPDLSTLDGWRELGQQTAAGTAYYGRDEDPQPLNAEQVAELSEQLKSGSARDVLSVMRNLEAMGTEPGGMGLAAAKQLGQTDPVFEYAARVSMGGFTPVATSIISGRKAIEGYKGGQIVGTPEQLNEQFNNIAGKALILQPDWQTIKDAAYAHFVDSYITRGKGVPGQDWDSSASEAFRKSLDTVLSGRGDTTKIGEVNGEVTVLPRGLTEGEANLVLDNLTAQDLVDASPQSSPPLDAYGDVVPADDIARAGALRIVETDIYQIQMDDGNFLAAGTAPDGSVIPYEIKFDVDLYNKVTQRPGVQPDSEAGGGTRIDEQLQTLSPVPIQETNRPEVAPEPLTPVPAPDVEGGGTPY